MATRIFPLNEITKISQYHLAMILKMAASNSYTLRKNILVLIYRFIYHLILNINTDLTTKNACMYSLYIFNIASSVKSLLEIKPSHPILTCDITDLYKSKLQRQLDFLGW